MKKLYIIKFGLFLISFVFMFLLINFNSFSQFSITSTGTNFTLDFENTVAGVHNDSIKGTGFTTTPAVGQFDSDAWAATGWSDGAMNFGDTKTSGDYARAVASAPVTTGGFYSFRVASGNYAFGIQPGGSDWAPGTLALKIQNNSGYNLSSITVSYNIYVRNDQPRANSFNFSHSADNVTYTPVTTLDYTSPLAITGTDWIIVPRSTIITGLDLANSSYYYLRWNGADAGGSGSRDEFALNDLVINATAASGVTNPSGFNALASSTSQIDLSWELNIDDDTVLVAQNSTNTFGTPTGVYAVGASISGGGAVLYKGTDTTTSHAGLTNSTEYFYKAWSKTAANVYSPGTVDSATTYFPEPTSHPTGLTAISNGPIRITVSWTDSDAAHYLIKGSSIGYSSIAPPVDGVDQADSLLVKNVDASVQSHQFTGLTPNTNYYFKIFPYNGGGESSNFKTDGTVPEASAKTDELDIVLIISEIAEPLDNFDARFVEITNTSTTAIDFSIDPVYLCRQANGNPGSWDSIALAGTLNPGESYIVASKAAAFDTSYNITANQYGTLVNVNGDDGLFLYYDGNNQTGFLIDAYGQIDVLGNIASGWNYLDAHVVRKREVVTFNSTWTADEWVIVKNVNFDNMTPYLHAEDVTWQGTTSTNWNTRGNNWSGLYGWVPDASCNITIPNVVNYPIVTEPSACHQLQIQSGSTLSVQSTGSLLIVGP